MKLMMKASPRGRQLRFCFPCLFLILSILAGEIGAAAPRIYRAKVEPHWFAGNRCFWYRNDNGEGTREFVKVDVRAGTRMPAFDHARVAEQMGADIDPQRLPVTELEFEEDGMIVRLIGPKQSWKLVIDSGKLEPMGQAAGEGGGEGLPPKKSVRPSRGGGGETALIFLNELKEPVDLFWLDPSGELHGYGSIQPGQRRRQHTFARHVWLVRDREGNPLAAFEAISREELAVIDGAAPKPRMISGDRRNREAQDEVVKSPDGRREAFVKDHQLWIRNLETDTETRLSTEGDEKNSFRRDAIRARAMSMNYTRPDYPESLPEVYWSPDSKKLVGVQTTVVPEPRVNLVVSSPRDQLQPKLDSYPYLKPGDPIPQPRLHLFDVEAGRELEIDSSRFAHPWSLGRYAWGEDSSQFYFLYNQRGHQVMRVLAFDLEVPGEVRVRTLVEEQSATFIDYSQKTYLHLLEASDELIWMSERDGWNHLYLYNLRTGEIKNQITRGEWAVRNVDRVDEEARQIWFRAVGIRPDQDPYHVHYCRVDFEGSNRVVLTEGDGTHSVQWSPDQAFLIDTWSRVDHPPVHELRRANDGSLVCRLETADAEEILDAGYQFPRRFVAKGRDGKTDIYGILHWPKDLDSAGHYPVVENIYAGPHGQHVPKSFRARYRHQQEIADRGFVVVQIDGMGTNWRSKSFHDVAWKNLADAGFPDRIAWIKSAARTFSWVDATRVGIYGGSAGGQNAMRAVLDHSDFYAAAAADCGCHDNRMDKIWWNEAWLGWPVDESYVKSSNTEDADQLGGALLLTVGELDKNVDPSSTYQVVDALKRAGKTFEFMLMTGQGHGAGESDFGRHLRADFLVRHLRPRGDFDGN